MPLVTDTGGSIIISYSLEMDDGQGSDFYVIGEYSMQP